MGEMEEKLNAILNDPQAMGKILSMAQSLGSSTPPPASDPPAPTPTQMPEMDMAALAQVSKLIQTGNIDPREKALLQALGAYLSPDRVGKLEKAMRAAKIAKLATVHGGGPFQSR